METTTKYDGAEKVTRETMRRDAWIRNVCRCLNMTKEQAQAQWDAINKAKTTTT
jgi:hypothetical protein